MINLATPVLEDLSHETGECSHFAVRMGDAVVVLARTSGREPSSLPIALAWYVRRIVRHSAR
jgi:DNA-binding IclR family transcriptional regulator